MTRCTRKLQSYLLQIYMETTTCAATIDRTFTKNLWLRLVLMLENEKCHTQHNRCAAQRTFPLAVVTHTVCCVMCDDVYVRDECACRVICWFVRFGDFYVFCLRKKAILSHELSGAECHLCSPPHALQSTPRHTLPIPQWLMCAPLYLWTVNPNNNKINELVEMARDKLSRSLSHIYIHKQKLIYIYFCSYQTDTKHIWHIYRQTQPYI